MEDRRRSSSRVQTKRSVGNESVSRFCGGDLGRKGASQGSAPPSCQPVDEYEKLNTLPPALQRRHSLVELLEQDYFRLRREDQRKRTG